MEPQSERILPDVHWHTNLSGRLTSWFDAVSMFSFAFVGVALTWYASSWVPGGWWAFSGSTDANTLTLARAGTAALSGVALFAAAMIAARFGMVDMPRDNRIVLGAKFAVAAMLGCGVLFIYHDPSIGAAPMVGLSMLAFVLLFRMEPVDAVKTSLAMALVSVPMLQAFALI